MQELRTAYRSLAWMAAIVGYLLLHYQQWQAGGGLLVGAVFAGLMLWSLQHLVSALGVKTDRVWRWWWKGALWRYPLMLLVLWAVAQQPIMFIAGFVGGVTLLPLSVGVLALSRTLQRPAWLSIRYWAPKNARKSREV